jgi:protease-4
MGKFLLGLATGFVLVALIVVIGVLAIASFRTRPPSVADGSTLILKLNGDVPEKAPTDFSLPFLQQQQALTVEEVWSILHKAAADPRIKAVVFEPQDAGVGWAKMQEIHADLEQFRKSGKTLIAYLKTPGTREYYMATACSKIYLSPTDDLDLKGLAFELMYFKSTLDKLGVQVDVIHDGKYKDFGDMFTRTSMSPETSEVMNSMIDDIYGDLVNTIAKGRGKDAAAIRATLDNGPFTAKEAHAAGLIDELRYEDEALGGVREALHQTALKKISAREYVNVSSASAGLGSPKEKIAFVVGDGTITRGNADSTDGTGIQSEAFDRTLNQVANEADVKGVIVRIDSGGGESVASDEMWRAMNELRKKKPLIISMSDEAASGGYYMAMTGDPIVAYPGTITGSIGVVWGKPDLRGLYNKVGVTKDFVSRGRYALGESDYQPLTDEERRKVAGMVDSDYQDFTSKVAAARKKPIASILEIAQGRVWMGDQAKGNGLVDELGGLDRAVELIRKKAAIPAGDAINLVTYPPRRSVLELLLRQNDESREDVEAEAVLRAGGLGAVAEAWRDASLRVWMRGGMLRMMPMRFGFR